MDTSELSPSIMGYVNAKSIEVLSVTEAARVDSWFLLFGSEYNAHYCNRAREPYDSRAYSNNFAIVLGGKLKNIEPTIWHELGHAYHELGTGQYALTNELAANAWAFIHYEGSMSMIDFVKSRVHPIMSYIDGGETVSIKTDELEATAKSLGVYDLISWVNE